MAGSGRYRAEDAAQLLLCPLDDLTLVYHRRSGVTHMVLSPVPEILAVMGTDDLSSDQILARLSFTYDLEAEDAESLDGVLVARLEEMVALGLAERV